LTRWSRSDGATVLELMIDRLGSMDEIQPQLAGITLDRQGAVVLQIGDHLDGAGAVESVDVGAQGRRQVHPAEEPVLTAIGTASSPTLRDGLSARG